jgi:hypothetical protein
LEETMENDQTQTLPRWMFLLLTIGGAWASGIYLGKMTIAGISTGLLIPTLLFGAMALIMAWGAYAGR